MLLGDPLRVLQPAFKSGGKITPVFFATLPPRGRPSCVQLPRPRGGAEGVCEAHERVAWLLLASWQSCGTRPSLLIGRLGCMLRLQKAGQEEGWIGRGGWIPGVEASRPPRRTRGSTTGSMGRMGR